MDDLPPEQQLTAQLQAEARRGVRPDLDLWPAIRAQIAARPPAAGPRPARPAFAGRRAALGAALLLVVVGGAAVLAAMRPAGRVIEIGQTVTATRQVVLLDSDGAIAQAEITPPLRTPAVATNAGPPLPPPYRLVTATVTLTLERVILAPGGLEAILHIGVESPDSRLARLVWRPAVTLGAGPVAAPVPGQCAPQEDRWVCRFPGAAGPGPGPLVVTELLGAPGAIHLRGPWVFPLAGPPGGAVSESLPGG